MKKIIFIVTIIIFSLGMSTAYAIIPDSKNASNNIAVPAKMENKLSEEEINCLKNRVEEIRDMDKSNLTVKERRALRNELKGIKESVRRDGEVIYISSGTIILIIILIIILV